MRDTSDSRTLPLSLGKPARKRTGQSGAAFLPPLSPAAAQEREFQQERIARRWLAGERSIDEFDAGMRAVVAADKAKLEAKLEAKRLAREREALLSAFALPLIEASRGTVA